MGPESLSAEEAGQEAEAQAGPNWLALANAAHEGSTTYLDTNLRRQWERNLRQFRSQHPLGSKYLSETWKGKAKFFRPKTRAGARKAEASAAAAFFSTVDPVDIEAANDRIPKQVAASRFWKEVMKYRLAKSVPWFLTVMGAYQDTHVMGAVVSRQDWDHELDRPDVEIRPLENIRIDPACKWTDPINTSPYVIDLMPMYVHEVRARIASGEWNAVEESQLLTAKTETFDSTRLAREGQRTDPKENQNTGIKDFDVVWVRKVIMRQGGGDVLYYTLGDQALLAEPVPLEMACPWLPLKTRPYVMGICVIEAHRNYPSAPVELTYPVQAEINDIVNQRRDNVRLVLDKRYFVKRNRQVDIRSLTRNMPGSATMMEDPKGDVEALEWNDVTSSAYAEEDRLNLDFDDLAGTFSGSSVQSNRKLNETVGGMNLISSSYSELGDYALKTFIETWMEPVLRQLLLMEQHNETDLVIMSLAGERAKLADEFGVNKLTDEFLKQELNLTVNVAIGSTNPINSVERFMMGIGKLAEIFGPEFVASKLDFAEVSAELFGKLGYREGSRFMLDEDDPRVAALTKQIQDLQQKVAQKRSPEVDSADAMQKRASAVKTLVEAVFGATQAGEIIASIPETAPVADKVLEAAGYTPPNPPGVDPNLPAPSVAALPRPALRQNTSPLEPAIPESASAGVNAGIEGGNA